MTPAHRSSSEHIPSGAYPQAEQRLRAWHVLIAGLGLLLATGGGLPRQVAWAQAPYGERPSPDEVHHYTYAMVGVPLAEALERLIDDTDLNLIYTSELAAGRTTFCTARRVTQEELLGCVLRGTGLDYARLSSGTYMLIASPQQAPLYAALSGQVLDADTGVPLADASVSLVREGIGTATNSDGRFSFPKLKPGVHQLAVTHVAYQGAVDTVHIAAQARQRATFALKPRIVLAEPVIVNGFAARLPSERLGTEVRSAYDLTTPQGLGTADVVSDLATVPGVQLDDAVSDVHVQGGASNEQQFLLDGIPVYTPVPNGGYIGPFSPFALSQVTVRKAGFGAQHGSYLSGAIEVDHQQAPRDGRILTAQADPLSANGRWTGRARLSPNTSATWMVAGRKSLWDTYRPRRLATLFRSWGTPDPFLLEALQDAGSVPVDAQPEPEVQANALEVKFSDLHAAARVSLSDLKSLSVSVYRGHNGFGVEANGGTGDDEDDLFEDAYRWHNRVMQVRYDWVQSHRLFMNAGVWNSRYHLVHPVSVGRVASSPAMPPEATGTSEDFNTLNERGVWLNGDWAYSDRQYVSGGLRVAHALSTLVLSPDPFGTQAGAFDDFRPVRWRLAGFLEDRITLSPQATLTLGTRFTYLPSHEAVYAEPRMAFRYDGAAGAKGAWATRWAVGRYRQYVHAFDAATYNVTALLPRVRFWLPVEEGQRPPEAYHATGAFIYQPDETWTFGIEGYYKRQPHVLVLNPSIQAAAPTLAQRDAMVGAEGYAYGTALTASRNLERLQIEGQYEYAVARRRTPGRFGNAYVPVPWDAPHRLYAALDVLPLPHWTATLRWQGVFGRSWGFRQAYYDYLAPDPDTQQFSSFDLSDPAAHTLPALSRWDAGLAYGREIAGVAVQGRVMLVNLLGRRNITDWSLRYDEEAGSYVREARRAAAFIPSFSLQVSL